MLNVLEKATIAARQENWSLLNQYLHQLLQRENSSRTEPETAIEQQQLLDWALEILEAGDFQERWDVGKVIPKLGQCAIAPLIHILKDEDAEEELRWFAARILGEFNHPAVISTLVELLKTSESEELNSMAAEALANFGASAIAALTDLLVEEETRLLAVRSLSHIRRSETIAPLLSVVSDSQVSVRVAAIEALSSFHDCRIPPVLLEALQDIAAPVRREAVIGLGLRADLREELDLVNQLKSRLWDFNLDVCSAAAIALGRLGSNAAADALFEVLQSPHTPLSLQMESVRALGWIETSKALAYLQQVLSGERGRVGERERGRVGERESGRAGERESGRAGEREKSFASLLTPHPSLLTEIVMVLGRVEQPALIPIAAEILIDPLKTNHSVTEHASVKQALAMSLAQLGESAAVEPLIHLLADSNEGVRWHAIAALRKFPNATVVLQQLANDENVMPGLKQGVAIALQELNRSA